MPDMTPLPQPVHLLDEKAPSVKEILTAIKRKSNGAAPGIDCISYVPYKRCSSLLPILVSLFEKI
jgi:hypothetical protein